MITDLTVSNFKSIVKETSLPLAPLTILAGPNSSGKSTILQALLLVSQTISHQVGSRSVVLNGTLAKLGQFDDLRSYGGEYDHITIGWKCQPRHDNIRSQGQMGSYWRQQSSSIKDISCTLSFEANPDSPERELYQLQPQLTIFSMSILDRGEDNTDRISELSIAKTNDIGAKLSGLKIKEPENEIASASLNYDLTLRDKISLDELREEFKTAEPVGCILHHFLPKRFSIRINLIEEISRHIKKVLIDEAPRYRRERFLDRELVIPEALIRELQTKLGERYAEMFIQQPTLFESGTGMPVNEWFERIRKMPMELRREMRREMHEWSELETLISSIQKSEWKPDEPEYQLLPYHPPIDVLNASFYLEMFFSDALKYLGPLRDEPKPLYPLTAHADPTDIGLKGEMTAAVLNLHRDRRIKYIPSSAFSKTPLAANTVSRTLGAAVTDWLQYLDIAKTVLSIDKGKLGHELKVSLADDGPNQDLTHVGVGVSQVLPILVMSLLAEQDTALIFEQPELHLHPKIQTRLADFFLSIVLSGKQCLIETHSEYLINRLRCRAAREDTPNRVTDNLKIYFVEKKDGTSDFREVKVNEYGAILDWPDGFFDQGQLEAENILRSATAKKKQQREK